VAPTPSLAAALDRQDWSEALTLAMAAGGDGPDEPARLDAAADAAWWLGRIDECIELREQAYRAFEDLCDTRRAGQCAVWLWEHHAIAARPAMAGAWLARARRCLAEDTECPEYVALLLREAETAAGNHEHDRALELAEAALSLARRLRSDDLEAEALQTLGRVLIGIGRIAEGMRLLDEAMLLAVEGRLRPYSTGKVYCSLISACEDLGDLERAAEWTDATQRWAERHPFAIFPGICRVHHAVLLKQRGDLAAAEREASRAIGELRDSHVGNAAAACVQVGDIRRRLGDLDGAAEAFAQAQDLCGGHCPEIALLRLAEGRPDLAHIAIDVCVRNTPAGSLPRSRLLPAVIQIAIAEGDLVMASAALAELEDLSDRFDTPLVRAVLDTARGRVALALDDAAGAEAALNQARDEWVRLAIPYETATVWTLLGQARQGRADEAGATEAFAAALELFEAIGAAPGIATDAPPVTERPRPAGLTAREVEVLALVAEGLPNKGIAERLFLSEKTVSRHLSNIYTKIGVNSRAAATAFAFEQGVVGTGRA
jgi:ATP/maltotriose-dependent transcriptional regulator MalT